MTNYNVTPPLEMQEAMLRGERISITLTDSEGNSISGSFVIENNSNKNDEENTQEV